MVKSPVNASLNITTHGKPFHFLLAALLAQIVVSPFVAGEVAGVAQDLIFLCLMGAALRVVRQSRLFPLILCLSVLCAISVVGKYILDGVGPSLFSDALGAPVILLTAVEVTRYLARQKRVDLDTVLGGLCVYLFLGALWFVFYSMLHRIVPGSFAFTVHGDYLSPEGTDRLLFFFSYITLLTTGYGDIVPLSPAAQTLAVLEGITGQFYLVFFMARLVGLHVAGKE